jgi:hypothetical protein
MTKTRNLSDLLDANGKVDNTDILNVDAAKITTGTLADARVPDLNASKITAGTLTDARIPANALNSNIDLTNLSASNLTSGTVATARLGTGTADATTFLRGDNTFNAPPLGGITEADMFRLTANLTSNADPISSNWERVDDASFSKIGTGMTNSSGIWSFPTTGLYLVQFNVEGYAYNVTVNCELWSTINNSTYTREAISRGGDADGYYFNLAPHFFVNVTDTSNVKVKARVSAEGSWAILGSTDQNETYLTFIRLGDSQ